MKFSILTGIELDILPPVFGIPTTPPIVVPLPIPQTLSPVNQARPLHSNSLEETSLSPSATPPAHEFV